MSDKKRLGRLHKQLLDFIGRGVLTTEIADRPCQHYGKIEGSWCRWAAGTVAVASTIYGLMVWRDQLRSGFDALGVLLGLASLVAAIICWWFTLQKRRAEGRTVLWFTVAGALIMGGIGFTVGFFGPMILMPRANQGPLLGIFLTGPLGFVIGAVSGCLYGLIRTHKWRKP